MYADVLETMWSTGRNRYVKAGYVWELKDTFVKGGFECGALKNRIVVLYSAEEVCRIWESMEGGGDGYADDDDGGDREVSFLCWASVNDTKVEVMLYDKDRLLADLNIKLCINRRDPRLPDNYGQIWTQLVSVASDAVEPSAYDWASPINYKLDLGRDDWDRLAAATTNGRTREAVEAAFYTSNGGDGSYYHTTSLLKTMDDAAYRKVCRAMWTAPDLALVDLKYLLRSKRPEMETAVQTALDGLCSSRGSTDKYPGDTITDPSNSTYILKPDWEAADALEGGIYHAPPYQAIVSQPTTTTTSTTIAAAAPRRPGSGRRGGQI
ncbi:hypothetical protein CMUS01_15844 [Colletotrichum musicola]|uniref:Uncharacterized protein n=1 Tax=Colletotrichum musicola TaxID=2175873 RepID=A0A8H6MKX5_9PEZI|nr:hypothetical protein CMUS01_15844 [Colletotrichum musicola]